MQRTLDELFDVPVAVAVEPGEDTGLATARVLGRQGGAGQGETVSAWPAAGLTLAVAAQAAVGCAATVATGSEQSAEDWGRMLGSRTEVADQVAELSGERWDVAAARVHAAVEAMNQVGSTAAGPLTVTRAAGAWAVFACDGLRIATLATTVRDIADTVVLAVAIEGATEGS
jgi:enediyne polyketide synthase